MSGPFVKSAILSGAEELIHAHGKQPATVARRSGIPVAALRDPDLLISGRAVILFYEIAASVCGSRNWGLQMARGARLAAVIGPLWILIHNARNVRQMCADLSQYFDLYTSAAVINWQQTPGGGLLSWSAAAGQVSSEVQMAEFAMATICREVASHMPHEWSPQAVLFRHAAPDDLRLHRQLFCSNVRFNQDYNALSLDDATLDQALHGAGHARTLICTVLRHESVLTGSEEDQTAMKVEGIVRALLPFSACTLPEVSKAMGMAHRTLQEHLQHAGKSFVQIKDGVRADLAMKYLRHSNMPAAQISDVLGYADVTSFSRSFRRWHGCSAREVRGPLRRV